MHDHDMPAFLQALVNHRPARNNQGISGTDIKRIMAGEWPELYLEKTGQVTPEPLTDLAPLLGKYIEPFHRAWYEWKEHTTVTDDGTVSIYFDPDHRLPCAAYVTLDGRIQTADNHWIPWEAKTVGAYIQRDKLIEREYPQLQWQIMCEGAHQVELSIMYLNQRWECVRIERDDEAIAQLVDMATQFWQHVIDGVMPQAQIVEQVAPVRELVDMRGSEDWSQIEKVWMETRQPAKQFQKADKDLKKLIPADAKTGFGSRITFQRNKAGAVTLLPMTREQREQLPE
jgi:hypothetical protein